MEGNSPVAGEFPAQKASNAENVSIQWRHHGKDNDVCLRSGQLICLAEENSRILRQMKMLLIQLSRSRDHCATLQRFSHWPSPYSEWSLGSAFSLLFIRTMLAFQCVRMKYSATTQRFKGMCMPAFRIHGYPIYIYMYYVRYPSRPVSQILLDVLYTFLT